MIKNKKATTRGFGKDFSVEHYWPHAPDEDWLEVYFVSRKDNIKDNINWSFVSTLINKAPTFKNIHKLLENAVRKQLRKARQ